MPDPMPPGRYVIRRRPQEPAPAQPAERPAAKRPRKRRERESTAARKPATVTPPADQE